MIGLIVMTINGRVVPVRPAMIIHRHILERDMEEETVVLPIDGVLDLHTFLPREIKDLVPAYLSACRAQGIYEVRIVHGKGTGNLRRTVHAVLSRLDCVASFRLAEEGRGGWGATLVVLKREGERIFPVA